MKYKIIQDSDPQSPAEDGNTDVFIVANHRQFYVPAPGEKTIPDSTKELVKKYKKTHWIFQLEAYIHSGVSLALSNTGNFPDRQWDVSQVGFVFVSKEFWRLSKSARKIALGQIEVWNQYLSGDIWGYIIEDDDGNEVDSGWGYYGQKDCEEAAKSMLEHLQKKS